MNIYHLDSQSSYREGIKNILEIHFTEIKVKSYDFYNYKEQEPTSTDLLIVEPFGNPEIAQIVIDRHLNREGKVFILSSELHKKTALEYLKMDVKGYATKNILTMDLVRAVQDIIDGKRFYVSSVASYLHEQYLENPLIYNCN